MFAAKVYEIGAGPNHVPNTVDWPLITKAMGLIFCCGRGLGDHLKRVSSLRTFGVIGFKVDLSLDGKFVCLHWRCAVLMRVTVL